MKFLVVGINYAPENIGTGKYTGEMCEWLAARGHEVQVVTAPPYYPAWKTWAGHAIRWPRRERLNGVDIIRCPIWVPAKPRGLTRMLHLASFALSSAMGLAMTRRFRPDIVLNIAPTLASAPAAVLWARACRARAWLHIQDFELDAALDMGIVDAGRLKRLAIAAERALMSGFDRVSTISERMMERLGGKGVRADRQRLFPNWVDTDAISPLRHASPYRQELGIPDDAVVALYSGNMGLKQGLELLGQAAHALKDRRELHFVLGGEGPARTQLEAACAGLPNVHFLDLQPTARLNDWLGLADIHLLPQRADVADLVMPSKLTGMLASGRPTLATAHPGTGVANALASSGEVVPPGDLDAFVAALERLIANRERREQLGAAARQQALDTLSRQAMLNGFEADAYALLGQQHDPQTADQSSLNSQDPA